ncbi:hypothetical protein [Streptomyces sp. NPDC004726]
MPQNGKSGRPSTGGGPSGPTSRTYLTRQELEAVEMFETLKWMIWGRAETLDQFEQMNQSLDSIHQELTRTTSKLDDVQRQLSVYRERVDNLTSRIVELTDDQFPHHSAIADEWQQLLTGRALAHLVEKAVAMDEAPSRVGSAGADVTGGAGYSPEAHLVRMWREAELTRRCAESLIQGEEIDRPALANLLRLSEQGNDPQRWEELDRLVAKAVTLHQNASHLRVRPEFDFRASSAKAETVTLYSPECGYDRPVALVVLPAYRIEDKRLSLPTVMTAVPPGGVR